jgi:hypothetical protein
MTHDTVIISLGSRFRAAMVPAGCRSFTNPFCLACVAEADASPDPLISEKPVMVSLRMADHRDIGLGGELMGRQAVRR